MTSSEWEEYLYRYTERLGILCGTGDPTEEQMAIAREEADEAVEDLKPFRKPNA